MREDMYKVIVERPRWGSRMPATSRGTPDLEESPRCEGLRRRHRIRKSLNENLRPLERWLGSQVGRPWNKVYAELCAGIDRRSTVQQHIHQHVDDFVARQVLRRDGELMVLDVWSRPQPLKDRWAPKLYVDPDSGLLRVNRLRERLRRQLRLEDEREAGTPPEDRRELSPWRQLHRRNGVWYEVELAPLPRSANGYDVAYDVLRQAPVRVAGRPDDKRFVASDCGLFGRDGVYARSKRQLNRDELRGHGLHNE